MIFYPYIIICGICQIQSRNLPQMMHQYQGLRVSQNKNTYQAIFQQRLTDWIHGILLTECKRTLQIMNSFRWCLNLRIKHVYVIIYSIQFIIKPTPSNFYVGHHLNVFIYFVQNISYTGLKLYFVCLFFSVKFPCYLIIRSDASIWLPFEVHLQHNWRSWAIGCLIPSNHL